MPHYTPSIILVQPQLGENIGSACRGMANFGLQDLRLVAPRDGWPNARAENMSSGALEHMPEPALHADFESAIADLQYVYATTARPRDMVKPVFTPRGAVQDALQRIAQGQKVGFVFGRERTGLENDDIGRCQAVITVPTNPEFSSLNLGQAVLMMAYEWMASTHDGPERRLRKGDSPFATQDDLTLFLKRLDEALEENDFFKDDGVRPTVTRNIHNIFTRAELTQQEVRTLHGIVSAFIRKSGQ